MEMCPDDQQFVTLSLYATNIDEMLDHIEMAFVRLKEFNLKVNPKKCHFFQCHTIFLGYVLSTEGISTNLKKN